MALRHTGRRLALYLGGFTLIPLVLTFQISLSLPPPVRSERFLGILGFQLIVWYLWALLAPVVFLASRRWPLRGDTLLRHLPVHLGVAAAVLLVKTSLDLVSTGLFRTPPPGPPPGRPPPLLAVLARGIGPNLVAYVAIAAVSHALDLYRRYRERELASSRLEAQLARARLEVLEMQLRPHFLFNTLNAIAALVRREPEVAEDMIAALSDLLRAVLQRSGRLEVPLREELDLAQRYLEIEALRFRDRLRVEFEIEPGAKELLVPSMILQPLVENALRHGAARSSGASRVRVRAAQEDERLVLSVSDDGPGPPAGGPEERQERVGLTNTRERLRELYGERQRVELTPVPGGGATVRVEMPIRPAGPSRMETAEGAERAEEAGR